MKRLRLFFISLATIVFGLISFAQNLKDSAPVSDASCMIGVTVSEAIGAATLDLLERTENKAKSENCNSILVRINTPGGALNSTRLIVERILASDLAYVCLITPSGGHAGSAGAIILQACHVNGGVQGTNVGAATPILSSGGETPKDLRSKLINDTVSWLESITTLRKRNLEFSKEIVTEAKAYSSETAVKKGALDYFAKNENEFLEKINGKVIKVSDKAEVTLNTATIKEFDPGLRHKLFSFLADPEIAYMIFMASLALLYFEITHPGIIVPGVLGGFGLIVSLMSLHKLDVYWGGVGLIILGLIFMVAELFLPTMGLLGVAGVASFFFGSLFLFDQGITGFDISLTLIIGTTLTVSLFFLCIAILAYRTMRMKKNPDVNLFEKEGVVTKLNSTDQTAATLGKLETNEQIISSGQIDISGEYWAFQSTQQLKLGDKIKVIKRDGLKLFVRRV